MVSRVVYEQLLTQFSRCHFRSTHSTSNLSLPTSVGLESTERRLIKQNKQALSKWSAYKAVSGNILDSSKLKVLLNFIETLTNWAFFTITFSVANNISKPSLFSVLSLDAWVIKSSIYLLNQRSTKTILAMWGKREKSFQSKSTKISRELRYFSGSSSSWGFWLSADVRIFAAKDGARLTAFRPFRRRETMDLWQG